MQADYLADNIADYLADNIADYLAKSDDGRLNLASQEDSTRTDQNKGACLRRVDVEDCRGRTTEGFPRAQQLEYTAFGFGYRDSVVPLRTHRVQKWL